MSPPRQLGRYRTIKKLGTGATATTYLAMERVGYGSTTLLVCLKVPHRALLRDREFRDAFVGEARIAAMLDHPNIVQLQDVAHDDGGSPFLAFDFVEGMDLRELLVAADRAGALLDWRIVGWIALEVARALEHAHEDHRGSGLANERPPIVHRDLAPSNILLGRSGGVYVTDFGLARALDRTFILASGQRGRIAYTAPEYLMGKPYDARADLYSFGVVFFEALTGRRPYPAMHMHERNTHLPRVLRRDRPTIHDLRPELQPRAGSAAPEGLVELARILSRLLEPDPGARAESTSRLVDELDAIPLGPGVERELREMVRHRQPAERRSIRSTTGEQIASEWSSTEIRHVEYLARGFDPERDGVRVSAEGAERLIAAFAHTLNDSVDDSPEHVIAAGDATDPDRPALDAESLAATDPDRPVFGLEHPHVIGGAADPLGPIVPATRPGYPAWLDAPAPLAATVDVGTSPTAPVGVANAAPASAPYVAAYTQLGPVVEHAPAHHHVQASTGKAPQPPRFAQRQLALPTVHPAAGRRPQRALILAALAHMLFLLSVCVLSTTNRLLVPLMTGQLGYRVVDHTWTPIFTYGSYAALALAFAMGIGAVVLWLRDRRP